MVDYLGIVLAANRYKLGSINELGNPFVTSQCLKGRQRVLKTAEYCQSVFPLGHPLFGEFSFLGISFLTEADISTFGVRKQMQD